MYKQYLFCDRCKKDLDKEEYFSDLTSRKSKYCIYLNYTKNGMVSESIDLCIKCFVFFGNYLRQNSVYKNRKRFVEKNLK